ncbi:site-specific DNA-methyltransferase [Arthrobacter koreensis]|uniref:site-specific DNA-methyltransferase n=1 Tax=Arthrobacter koreensis TaxID=199136 RepID=UPI0038023D67
MSNEFRALLARVEDTDPDTAKELRRHIDAMQSRRQFGLNFERHTPESVALNGRPISVGDKVKFLPLRGETEVESDAVWVVTAVTGPKKARVASLLDPKSGEETERTLGDLVYVADFRDPIYPGLMKSDEPVLRGGDKPFHTIINGENYHALEAMLFTYQGKVDCIYIDPPYNTRANDWKYNNNYVDPSDSYAHSKWLAFMERRLKLAKKLLNPRDSVLIVTIDEKEVHRLALLLEQTFKGAKVQMVSSVINPKGSGRTTYFSRTDEFIFFVFIGSATVPNIIEGGGAAEVRWRYLRRTDVESRRGTSKGGPRQFYPIYVNTQTNRIAKIGEALPPDEDRNNAPDLPGCVKVYPIREDDGMEMNWGLTGPSLQKALDAGYLRVSIGKSELQPYIFSYLTAPNIRKVQSGELVTAGKRDDGSWIVVLPEGKTSRPTTTWRNTSHEAGAYGTSILRALLPGRTFPFPKSLYAVEDALRLFVGKKKEALVVDFFAGSGTTAHAVMRLNKQDDGRRRSVSVTNNEVNDQERSLLKAGLRPGDNDWESNGICERITKPRIRAAVTGLTPSGDPATEKYTFTQEFPMSDGFEENVEFFTLTYENPALVELDMAFERIAPLLWMRAGSEGRLIDKRTDTFDVAETYAVLFDVDASKPFLEALEKSDGLRMACIVTDDEPQYQAIVGQLPEGIESVRLYESYLRTFQINTGRA